MPWRSRLTASCTSGDSWSADIEGAHRAGIQAAWINRNRRPAPQADLVTHTLRGLSDLAMHLRNGEWSGTANDMTNAPTPLTR